MLKVCRSCGARPAHTLEVCPQCSAPIDKHGENYFWDYEVETVEATVETLNVDRPKDTDKVDVWKAYAKSLVEAMGNPTDAPEIDKLTKPELIELFG